jgi:hypothetical protein
MRTAKARFRNGTAKDIRKWEDEAIELCVGNDLEAFLDHFPKAPDAAIDSRMYCMLLGIAIGRCLPALPLSARRRNEVFTAFAERVEERSIRHWETR